MKELKDMELRCGGRLLCCGIGIGSEAAGRCILLCGANGSGKTTLLRLLAAENGHSACLIPTGIPKVKGFTVKEFISTGCYRESSWSGRVGEELSKRIDDALAVLSLSDKSGRDISTLSDGEFQKACIAVALATGAETILLDEPLSFLDPENRISVLNTLRRLGDEGRTVVFSSHDLDDSLRFCNEVWAIGADKKFHKGSEKGLKEAAATIFSQREACQF